MLKKKVRVLNKKTKVNVFKSNLTNVNIKLTTIQQKYLHFLVIGPSKN